MNSHQNCSIVLSFFFCSVCYVSIGGDVDGGGDDCLGQFSYESIAFVDLAIEATMV